MPAVCNSIANFSICSTFWSQFWYLSRLIKLTLFPVKRQITTVNILSFKGVHLFIYFNVFTSSFREKNFPFPCDVMSLTQFVVYLLYTLFARWQCFAQPVQTILNGTSCKQFKHATLYFDWHFQLWTRE